MVPDGVAFVALAPLDDPTLVISTIARSLDLRKAEGQTPRDALHTHLRDKWLLLLSDDFEQLLGWRQRWRIWSKPSRSDGAPHESRPAESAGKTRIPSTPLALPSSTRLPGVEVVAGSSSARLFAARARATLRSGLREGSGRGSDYDLRAGSRVRS